MPQICGKGKGNSAHHCHPPCNHLAGRSNPHQCLTSSTASVSLRSLSGGPQSDSALCARREPASFLRFYTRPVDTLFVMPVTNPIWALFKTSSFGQVSCHAYQILYHVILVFNTRSAPQKKAHSSLPLEYTKYSLENPSIGCLHFGTRKEGNFIWDGFTIMS